MRKPKPGDVVQLLSEKTSPFFQNCFMVVTQVEEWGCRGYIHVPNVKGPMQAAYRCGFDEVSYIGKAIQWDE
jgi:hypothetical protein